MPKKIRDYLRGQCCVCGNTCADEIRTHVVNGFRVDVCGWPDALEDCMSKLQKTIDEISLSVHKEEK